MVEPAEHRGGAGIRDGAASTKPQGWRKAAWLVACLGLLLLAQLRISLAPTWSWDLIAYVACVHEARGEAVEEIHQATFAELGLAAPAEVFERLTGGDSQEDGQRQYRSAVHQSPKSLKAQLGFYRGRWLYHRLLDGLSQSGTNPFEVAFGVSRVAGALLALLLWIWLARSMHPIPALACAWFAMEATGSFQTAANASPDSLATLLLIGGAFALVRSSNSWMAWPLMLAALGTRVDHALFVVPMLLWMACVGFGELRRLTFPGLAVALALCAAVICACTFGQDTYSWWTVHRHTFHGYMTFPTDQTPPADIASALLYSLRSLPKFAGGQALFFCCIPLAGIWLARRKPAGQRIDGLCVLALVGIFTHFTLFPVLWPRLMGPYWLLGWLGFADHIWPRKPAVPS